MGGDAMTWDAIMRDRGWQYCDEIDRLTEQAKELGYKPGDWAACRIEWRHGEQSGVYVDKDGVALDDDGMVNPYNYAAGNYACDCNRSWTFGLGEFECGHTVEVVRLDIIERQAAMP